jgi:hypothetical protein
LVVEGISRSIGRVPISIIERDGVCRITPETITKIGEFVSTV